MKKNAISSQGIFKTLKLKNDNLLSNNTTSPMAKKKPCNVLRKMFYQQQFNPKVLVMKWEPCYINNPLFSLGAPDFTLKSDLKIAGVQLDYVGYDKLGLKLEKFVEGGNHLWWVSVRWTKSKHATNGLPKLK